MKNNKNIKLSGLFILLFVIALATGCVNRNNSIDENDIIQEAVEEKIENEIEEPVEKLPAGRYRYTMDKLEVAATIDATVEAIKKANALSYNSKNAQVLYYIPKEIPVEKIKSVILETNADEISLRLCNDDESYSDQGTSSNSIKITKKQITGEADKIKLISIVNESESASAKEITSISFLIEDTVVALAEGALQGDLTLDCFKQMGNNNPLVTQRYSADPCAMVYEDTVYIYSTNDIYEYSGNKLGDNSYSKITTINCFGSKDLVNWTDYGAIAVAGRKDGISPAKWANNSWAPTAAHKTIDGKEKFFLYFADNGSGIGVLTSDSPTGPFVDPLGEQLVSRNTPTCDSVTWLFDPAVLMDDDGNAYLYFGGGVPEGQSADPGTARVVKLGEDMISLDGEPVAINPPYLFEDSGINKIGDTYYYSYCSNWNCADGFKNGTIYYMTSKNPMGPFEFQGEVFANPSSFFNDGNGNNHHSFFEFNGKLYITYHARAIETQAVGKPLGYRSAQIDEVSIEDGKLASVTATMQGVEKTADLNPYELQRSTTIYRQKGIEVFGSGDTVITVTEDDFTSVKGANFDKGASKLSMTVNAKETMTIDICVGNEKGTVIGTINVEPTNDEFKTFETQIKNQNGYIDIYFVYHGAAEVRDWIAE